MNENKISEHRGAMTAFALIAVAVLAMAGLGGALSPVQTAKADATHAYITGVTIFSGYDAGADLPTTSHGEITSNGGSITVPQGSTVTAIGVHVAVYKSYIPTLTLSTAQNIRADVTITPPTGSPTTIQVYDVLTYTNQPSGAVNTLVLLNSGNLGYVLSQTGNYQINIQLSAYY